MRSVKVKLLGSFAILFILTAVLVASSLEFINSGEIRAGANDLILTLGIIMMVIIVALAWILTINITNPLKVTTEVMNRISSGDLQLEPVTVKRKDDFGRMMTAVNQTLVALQQSVKRMQSASNVVADASVQLYTSSTQNLEAAKHVTDAIQEVARSSLEQAQTAGESGRVVDEMAIGVQRIAETTGDVSELSVHTAQQANRGSENIFDVADKMHRLSQSIESASETIHKLDIQSTKISDISSIIGGISYQTNLLALNAAIEAARAGEHGKGFAVVAGEVRKLASQSEESSRHIIDLISSIQKDTVEAVSLMGKSLVQVKDSLVAVELAEQSFKEIVTSTGEVSSRIQEAAASAEQLAASSEEVAASITNMEHLARRSAELSEEVAAATKQQLASSEKLTSSSQTLSGVSKDLESIVIKFKV